MARINVRLLLPFRVQVQDGTVFTLPPDDAGGRLRVTLDEFKVPSSEGQASGENVDDGRGTFLKTWAGVEFPEEEQDSFEDRPGDWGSTYLRMSRRAVNAVIDAYRVVSGHAAATNLYIPEQWHLALRRDDGIEEGHAGFSFGSSGVSLKGSLRADAVERVNRILTGQERLSFEEILLLDAERFASEGDVPHAILNISTALEVYVHRLLENDDITFYQAFDVGLKRRFGYSLHQGVGYEGLKRVPFYEVLEYIRAARNAVGHDGRAVFRLANLNRGSDRSRYHESHRPHDGRAVSVDDAKILVDSARKMMAWIEDIQRPLGERKFHAEAET